MRFHYKNDEEMGIRNNIIIRLMLDLGLRCSEIPNIMLSDIKWANALIQIHSTKNNHVRQLPLSAELGKLLEEYILRYRPSVPDEKYLLLRKYVNRYTSMSRENVRYVIRNAFEKEHIIGYWKGTHALRRTAASKIFNNGTGLKLTADILGHESLDSTKAYIKVDFEHLKAVRLLFQDAESMFQRDEGRKRSFRKGKKSIEVWDLSGFEIDLDDILSGLKYEDGHYDLVSLSDKDYQKKLDVQIACWDKLKNEIQKVRSGENGTADLVDMRETYFQMADETVAAVKVSRANRQLEQKAYIDLHTGLPNKSKCEELFHNVEFIKTPTACIVFDMNNLKRVNDSLGHSIGDQLILNFARLLRNSIPAKHFVGRYGGDELWRSSMMQPAKASQKSSQSFRTKSNSSTATEPSSASAIPTAWHFPPITTNVRSACCLTKQISICMKTSRDARTKETPEPEISYRRFWRFFLLFLFYFFANASICAYPAEKSMGSSRSFFLTASRPS